MIEIRLNDKERKELAYFAEIVARVFMGQFVYAFYDYKKDNLDADDYDFQMKLLEFSYSGLSVGAYYGIFHELTPLIGKACYDVYSLLNRNYNKERYSSRAFENGNLDIECLNAIYEIHIDEETYDFIKISFDILESLYSKEHIDFKNALILYGNDHVKKNIEFFEKELFIVLGFLDDEKLNINLERIKSLRNVIGL